MNGSRKPSPRYPLGTLMVYGPDTTRATKLVAAVFHRSKQRDAGALRRWFVETGDIRNDLTIDGEVADFFKQHGVIQTVSADRITGCPHEEGVDYPMGRPCPHCPFWANIDRFTHEPVLPPAPTLSPEQILVELSAVRDTQPLAALESADTHRAQLVEPLLQAVERGVANPSGLSEGEGLLFSYATYLLAKWRETRAYPLVIRWLSLPGEGAFEIGGDTVTQDGGRMLASVFDGDFEPLKSLILNRQANEYCRGQAVEAMALLAVWGEVPRETVEERFLWLAREGLEQEESQVWNELAAATADIEALGVFPALRHAYEEGWIDPGFMSPSELDEVEAGPRGKWIEHEREWHPPISDVARETSWWRCFKSNTEKSGSVRRPKIGRNDPCSCGSGKKYKKCCGA